MNQRAARIAEVIKEEVGQLLLHRLTDPRIAFASVTEVEVSGDLRIATIYFSVMGSETEKKNTLQGLKSSKGIIRRAVSQRLQLRNAIEIEISLDNSIERGAHILDIIDSFSPATVKVSDLEEDEDDAEEIEVEEQDSSDEADGTLTEPKF